MEDRDLGSILMNEEANACERDHLQHDTWSARTRLKTITPLYPVVLIFLHSDDYRGFLSLWIVQESGEVLGQVILEQRESEEEEKVSLLKLYKGRSQKESARLFYETLVLKTKGYLQVKQD